LNELARGSKDGIHPFSTATKQSVKGLLYDDKNPIKVFTDGDFSQTSYPLVADYLIHECHDDLFFFALYTIRKWKIFKEAGVAGWKAIIPIYSDWILCERIF
jgi:hypothetical protein